MRSECRRLPMIDAGGIDANGLWLTGLDKPSGRIRVKPRKMKVLDRIGSLLVSSEVCLYIWPFRTETCLKENDRSWRYRTISFFPCGDVVCRYEIVPIGGGFARYVDLYGGPDQLINFDLVDG